MKINKAVIKKLNPCSDRYENYLKFYKEKDFTPAQFMGLKNITQQDKLWVAFRLMPKESIQLAAADIAESVLHIFESKYPNDMRPRLAIEAARGSDKYAARDAAHAADSAADSAYAVYNAAYAARAARNAARDAASAAVYAAYAVYNAAYAARDAASAAADSAADSAASAATKKTDQEKIIRKILLKYLKEKMS